MDGVSYKLLLDLLNRMKDNNINVPLVSMETGDEYRKNECFAKKLDQEIQSIKKLVPIRERYKYFR